jgi:hypothetical protein
MPRKQSVHLLAICIDNADYEMSLELRKVYPVIPDAKAQDHNYVRVIDETGEDYLFPANRFVIVPVSSTIEQTITAFL